MLFCTKTPYKYSTVIILVVPSFVSLFPTHRQDKSIPTSFSYFRNYYLLPPPRICLRIAMYHTLESQYTTEAGIESYFDLALEV